MIRSQDLRVNLAGFDLVCRPVRNKEVINAPADIPFPGVSHVAPPGVFHLIRVQIAVCIHEAAAQQLLKGFALLVGESRVSAVRLGILQVDLACGHVQIATNDDRFSFCSRYT